MSRDKYSPFVAALNFN